MYSNMVLGEEESVLFKEVSLFQGCPYRGFHCIHAQLGLTCDGDDSLTGARDNTGWQTIVEAVFTTCTCMNITYMYIHAYVFFYAVYIQFVWMPYSLYGAFSEAAQLAGLNRTFKYKTRQSISTTQPYMHTCAYTCTNTCIVYF